MSATKQNANAFANFKVFKGDSSDLEKEQLFRNMAHLFTHVSEKCDDAQVTQYDEVLCKLAEIVEEEARVHVAELLAPLERAPGNVVVKLAKDSVRVARPLLEFSNVLSDDDLIEIVENQTENHREIIAGRNEVGERVGNAILDNSEGISVSKLVANSGASFDAQALEKILLHASKNEELEGILRNKKNINWKELRNKISNVGVKVLDKLSLVQLNSENEGGVSVSDVVYTRIRNKAGFNAKEWKIAYNQVKALNDRRQLNNVALARFVRFGYGHHVGAALSILMRVTPQVFVKLLAMQDYDGITSACKALDLSSNLFEGILVVLPWRDVVDKKDVDKLLVQFEKISKEQAAYIFSIWRNKIVKSRYCEVE